jgi:hypothetical protein
MNGEVQLIVTNDSTVRINSISNDPTIVGIGVLSRLIVNSTPEVDALVNGDVLTIQNAAGQSVNKTVNSIQLSTPVPGQTRINFFGTWAQDYSAAAGGYFILGAISDYYLDLFENESISQNWKFQDLSNFTAQGAFSREFRIPMSDNNIKAIGPLFDTNSEQGAENYFFYKLPAEIRVDTLPIATGYLRVRKVYKQMNRINEVEVAFYAETPDLVRTIGEKKLSDIAALADLNEVVNYANVTTETADRIWTLCDRGQRWSNDGSANSRPILNPTIPINAADLTPAISWWYLLRNIVTEAGFDLVASSLENIIEDYYMPFCNTQQLSNTGGSNQFFFRAYPTDPFLIESNTSSSSIYTNMTEVFDNSNDFNPVTGIYTASAAGTFTFHIHQYFQTAGGAFGTNYIVILLRTYKNGEFYNLRSTYFYLNTFTSTTALLDTTFSIDLQIGDEINFHLVKYQSTSEPFVMSNGNLSWTPVDLFENGTVDVYGSAGDGTSNTSYIEINSATITIGQTIDYRLNAPDMRQIDFVNDVIKMHNCAIVPSRIVPNRIAIVPQNNYIGTGDVVDWTSKLDISKDVVIGSTVDIQKATFQFTYTAGEDAYSKLYKDANRVYGDFKQEGYTINPSTAPSDFAIGEQKVTLVTRSTPAAFIPGTGTPIPCFYNEDLEFVAPGPRALFYAGSMSINLYNDGTSSASPATVIPILNHYSDAYPTLTDFDLNWAPETPPHFSTVSSNPYNNLFNTYWRNYMNELYSPEGRIMEAFFALDLKDILTFSFADKIWIQDSYWRILEISDYKVGLQESTKVKLIKFLDQINDCSSTPVGVTTNGEVEFETGGEPVEPTEDCCSRYGYFWDEVNGVCWAFNNGGQFRNSIVSSTTTLINSPTLAFDAAPSSVVNGNKVSIGNGNGNSLAVGQDLTLTKFVNGSNLLGKNVTTNLPGLHVGGGYRNGDSTSIYYGWAQFGFVVLQKQFSPNASGDVFNLDIEGVVGEYIDIEDDTIWSCSLNLNIRDAAGLNETSLHHFTLEKTGSLASASAVSTLNTIGGIGSYVFTLGIDTTTNTAEHRINLTITGGTYPVTLVAGATLQYQQLKFA